jgi:hypothetical protein
MKIDLTEIIPEKGTVLLRQGIPKNFRVSDTIQILLAQAYEMFLETARPEAMTLEISADEFSAVFYGFGKNEAGTPLQHIFPQAAGLALMACTLGRKLSETITESFKIHDAALGAMLDTIASLAVENAVGFLEKDFCTKIKTRLSKKEIYAVNYSPGYCGWHISAQEQLFKFLRPHKIGITLNSSFLMSPIKSVSGVLAAGPKEIHIFKNDFPFCRECKDKTCLKRMKTIK